MTRKKNFLARAYGFRVPQVFKCEECGASFRVLQRFEEIDDLEFYEKTAIQSQWLDVKLHRGENVQRTEDVSLFFYFDCPHCQKRHFTAVYDPKMWERFEKAGYWSTLAGFESNHIDESSGYLRKNRAAMEARIANYEKAITGQYVKDIETGLYSKVEFYHGKC